LRFSAVSGPPGMGLTDYARGPISIIVSAEEWEEYGKSVRHRFSQASFS